MDVKGQKNRSYKSKLADSQDISTLTHKNQFQKYTLQPVELRLAQIRTLVKQNFAHQGVFQTLNNTMNTILV
ncbi:hypothetical protein L596_013305 [Steinernema carpocapsae]|uniref:Uncharacterized protein n=1 Tax=Steinernema carpocapsae TaxID=34508 RepID=A0A4U5P0K9_STECR|nr:hypothetical protein L596_013305 [Steinernema carpocapsae]